MSRRNSASSCHPSKDLDDDISVVFPGLRVSPIEGIEGDRRPTTVLLGVPMVSVFSEKRYWDQRSECPTSLFFVWVSLTGVLRADRREHEKGFTVPSRLNLVPRVQRSVDL